MEKQVSLSGFQLKGAGWYVTDYVKKSSAAGTTDSSVKSEKSEKGEKSEKSETTEKISAGESTAKTETASNTSNDTVKPAAKTETVSKKE